MVASLYWIILSISRINIQGRVDLQRDKKHFIILFKKIFQNVIVVINQWNQRKVPSLITPLLGKQGSFKL